MQTAYTFLVEIPNLLQIWDSFLTAETKAARELFLYQTFRHNRVAAAHDSRARAQAALASTRVITGSARLAEFRYREVTLHLALCFVITGQVQPAHQTSHFSVAYQQNPQCRTQLNGGSF